MSDTPIFEYVDEACMFVRWRSIAFPVFGHRMPTVAAAETLGRHLEQHGRRLGKGKLLEITLLDDNVGVPEAKVREALDAMVPKVSPYYGCVSAVYECAGFRAAMIRGVLTGFQMLSRLSYPHKIFGSVEECASWVYPHALGLGMQLANPAELATTIRAIQAVGVERGVLTARPGSLSASAP